jgi:MerR family transcriptional regulator, redox-sensitive transcriptional activator SoxR
MYSLELTCRPNENCKILIGSSDDGLIPVIGGGTQMTISEAARQLGLQASAIRYYEQIGLLPAAERVSGQRRYDTSILYRLAIIQRARQLGFTLEEIRQLFFGFRGVTSASQRWRTLNQKKLAELDALLHGIKEMQRLLRRMNEKCHCQTLEQCGKGIFLSETTPDAGSSRSCMSTLGSRKKQLRNSRRARV